LTKRLIYIITGILSLALISACTTKNRSVNKSADQTTTILNPINITTLNSKEIDVVSKQNENLNAYQYQSGASTIGEFVQQEFGKVRPANTNKEICSVQTSDLTIAISPSPVLKKTMWLLEINFDNDIFNNTDYYYTNGAQINLSIPALRFSPVNKIFPAPKNHDIEFCGLSLTQNIYTPTNPDTKDILFGDRPFSAFLTLGQFREVYDLSKNIYIKSQINLGILGPGSLGGQVQSSIHEITPVGWQNQISNDFVIDYSFDFKKGIVNSSIFDFNVNANANVGSLYDKVGGGFDFRFGHFMPFYQGPVSVFEGIGKEGSFQFWFFVKSSFQLVVYDATLQGGLFNHQNVYTIEYKEINHFVFNASAGFALYHDKLGIEYENFYLSPEFKGARQFGWGRIKAVLAF
jgi:lipid A 3-O-deacylase